MGEFTIPAQITDYLLTSLGINTGSVKDPASFQVCCVSVYDYIFLIQSWEESLPRALRCT